MGSFNDYVDQILAFFDHHLPIVDKRGHFKYHLPYVHVDNSPPPPFSNETPYIVFRGDKYGKMSSKVESLIFSVLNISNKGFLLKPNTTIA